MPNFQRGNCIKGSNKQKTNNKNMATIRIEHIEKMYSIFLIFVWRRKLIILLGLLVFLIGVWAWTFYHAEYNISGDSLSFNDDSNKMLTVDEFDGTRDRIIAKYGGYVESKQNAGVQFVRPTYQAPLIDNSMRLRERFQSFSSLFSNKDAAKVLQNLEQPSHDEIGRRKDVEHIHLAAEKQSQYERELHRMGIPIVAGIGPGAESPPNQRLVHLDLKGAPPKISYLKRILPIIKTLGATGLLIEYEDMFSFTPPIERISAKNAYTELEIRDLLQAIAATGLTVMPLVQTFGHMEFALKLKEYEHLREVADSPQSLCPSRNESINLVETMIRQVIEMHQSTSAVPTSKNVSEFALPRFTHIHIGCDEVYRIGLCDRCQSKNRNDLFLSHVRYVAEFIRRNWPALRVVIWDDMLRTISLNELQKSKISKLVEPMVWVYVENIYRFISPQTWNKYSTIFSTIWTASAFKGAFGESLAIPLTRRHLENNLKWLSVINAEKSRFSNGIQGIALTGWQRYDHFAVLCELFAVAIPTLAICLSVTSQGYFDIDLHRNHIIVALTCPEPSSDQLARRPWIDLHDDSELISFSKCIFPGSQVLRFVTRLMSTVTETRQYLNDQKFHRGWLTPYNIRHQFTSPIRVEDSIGEAVQLEATLNGFIKMVDDVMIDVYDKWTIDEFIEQTIRPLIDELRTLTNSADHLMAIRVWPRRPIPYAKDNVLNEGRN